jgi:hypothetical protein
MTKQSNNRPTKRRFSVQNFVAMAYSTQYTASKCILFTNSFLHAGNEVGLTPVAIIELRGCAGLRGLSDVAAYRFMA